MPPVRPDAKLSGGYGPSQLRSAYQLPADGGSGQTIAVVAAYDAPYAEADLGVYRARFELPPCTTANGCFRKVDQRGGDDYPQPDYGWAAEIALDLDMVSAIAPRASIMLVEADTAYVQDLAAAVDQAVTLGATYVSNSYGTTLYSAFSGYASHFDHPGVAIVAAAGDSGLGVAYPAGSEKVVAVGGTSLIEDDSERGWSERVWNSTGADKDGVTRWGATGSGCATQVAKPAFQTDPDCRGRAVADISAVGDPFTGVSVYNSFSDTGWAVYGGTSASAPIIAGVYALAGDPVLGTYPNSYPYQHPEALNDITAGDNASCPEGLCPFPSAPKCQPGYICLAGTGYDGPTGLGTPNGLAAFRGGPHGTITGRVTDAGSGTPLTEVLLDLGTYHTVTGEDGRYRLTVPEATYHLVAAAYGYAPTTTDDVAVPNGTEVTRDLTLTALPSQTVNGRVTDGGGHGWPLYAKITVDKVPGAPVFTDPTTGAYALKLQYDATYTLRVTAMYPGYQEVVTSVPVGPAPALSTAAAMAAVQDIEVPVDPARAEAPGYSLVYHGGGVEAFDRPTVPAGWRVTNHTDLGGWVFDDPLGRGNSTGGGGRFAILDGFHLGWESVDSELVSPSYNLSAEKDPEVTFDTFVPPYQELGKPDRDLDVSVDGGDTWTTVWSGPGSVAVPTHVTVPLSAYAGQRDVRIRFHYSVPGLGGIWQIDNVAVGTRDFVTVPGGLIVGQVTDANTGAGVIGATVATDAADPADPASGRSAPTAPAHTTSVPTAADPVLGDGWYWLFSPITGQRTVTVDRLALNYPALARKITVSGGVTRADFALTAGLLTVAPGSLTASLFPGIERTIALTVSNTGGAPARFIVGEQAVLSTDDGLRTAPARVPRLRVPASKLTAKLDSGRWLPPTFRTSTEGHQPERSASTGWRKITETPRVSALGLAGTYQGQLYLGWGDTNQDLFSNDFMRYDPTTATWTALASAGYRRYSPSGGFINGRFYVTGGRNTMGRALTETEIYDPATDTWSSGAPIPTGYGTSGSAILNGKLYVIGGCRLADGVFGDVCGFHDVQVYDPATDTWSRAAAYPLAIAAPSCGAIGDRIYCAGGGDSGGSTSDAFSYHPATNTWSKTARLPIDLYGSAHCVANGQLLVSTGYSDSTRAMTNEGYAYDPATNSWAALPNAERPGVYSLGALGFYRIGGDRAVDGTRDTRLSADVDVLSGWDQPYGDLPWLSVSAETTTLGPGQSAKILVTLRGDNLDNTTTVTSRSAVVSVDSDTPYPSITIPVAISVAR
jgi:N-acetylneuraminic acid mutarotase